jgi:hypothetical protein
MPDDIALNFSEEILLCNVVETEGKKVNTRHSYEDYSFGDLFLDDRLTLILIVDELESNR